MFPRDSRLVRTKITVCGPAPRETRALAGGYGGGPFLNLCLFIWAERSSIAAVAQARPVEKGLIGSPYQSGVNGVERQVP